MIEYPVLQELLDDVVADRLRQAEQMRAQASIIRVLKARFGPDAVSADMAEQIRAVVDEQRLEHLLDRAAVCQDIEAFRPALSS